MALFFLTDQPSNLLSSFKKAIDAGHVVTWSYDKDGDFTHTAQQWKNLAWLRPSTVSGRLVLNILKPNNANISWEVYGIYQGRFIESVTIHCHGLFTSAQSKASPTQADIVT
jgi:hypothetical protein